MELIKNLTSQTINYNENMINEQPFSLVLGSCNENLTSKNNFKYPKMVKLN
jgi:hypothetical protein